jgi:uncharacterized low-complexity protein
MNLRQKGAVLAALSCFHVLESSNAFAVVRPKAQRADISVAAQFSKDEDMAPASSNGRREFLAAAVSASAIFAPSLAALADEEDAATTTLHILDYPIQGKCGEAKVPEKGVFFAKTFGNLVEGSCPAEGYMNDEGKANGTGDKDQKRIYNIYGK